MLAHLLMSKSLKMAKTKQVYISATTGKYVTKAYATQKPNATVRMTVKAK